MFAQILDELLGLVSEEIPHLIRIWIHDHDGARVAHQTGLQGRVVALHINLNALALFPHTRNKLFVVTHDSSPFLFPFFVESKNVFLP